ncbi:hypothetical protein DYQ86_06155 [Acidobacteria bacterium AB60]|nr:hypothetical protein DYQ86_06155 [Acidobacteria bacterium AB60]
MSIEGSTFCDVCGGAISRDDLTAVKMEREGHMVLFHFHNRHEADCLGQKLMELDEKYANAAQGASESMAA